MKFTSKKQIDAILAGVVECAPLGWHSRIQDDHDGTNEGIVTVIVAQDGDTHIGTAEHPPIRFRNYFGGTNSPRVHTALMILAHAIIEDNKDHPLGNPLTKESR